MQTILLVAVVSLLKLIFICILHFFIKSTNNEKLKERKKEFEKSLFYGDIIGLLNEGFVEFMIAGYL